MTLDAAISFDMDSRHDDDYEECLKQHPLDVKPVVVLTRLPTLERLIGDLKKEVADILTARNNEPLAPRFSPEVEKAFEQLRCLRAEKAARKRNCEYSLASSLVTPGLARPSSLSRKRRSDWSDMLLNNEVLRPCEPSTTIREPQQPLETAGRAVDVNANRPLASNRAAAERAKPQAPPTHENKRDTSEEREPRFQRQLGPRKDNKTSTKRARQLNDQQSSCTAMNVLGQQERVVVSASKQKRTAHRTSALWGLSEPNKIHRRLLKKMALGRQPVVRKTTSFEERARATSEDPLPSVVDTLASCSTTRPDEPSSKQRERFLCYRCGHIADSRADRLKHVAEHESDCSCCSDFYKRCSNKLDRRAGVCWVCRERVPHLFAHMTLHHGDVFQ